METKKELIEDLWKVNTPEEDDKFLLWLCNKGALQDFRNKINLKHSQSLLQQSKEFIEMIDNWRDNSFCETEKRIQRHIEQLKSSIVGSEEK